MTISEGESALFDEWSAGRSDFARDGVIDSDAYDASSTKVLVLLKEVHRSPGTTFDLRRYLRDDAKGKIWVNVARLLAAVRQMEHTPTELPRWDSYQVVGARRRDLLRSAVVMNLRKASGGAHADDKQVLAAARDDAKLITRQLQIYRPDVIVCGGWIVSQFLDECVFPLAASAPWAPVPSTGKGAGHYRRIEGRPALVWGRHPAAVLPGRVLIEPVVAAVFQAQFAHRR